MNSTGTSGLLATVRGLWSEYEIKSRAQLGKRYALTINAGNYVTYLERSLNEEEEIQ